MKSTFHIGQILEDIPKLLEIVTDASLPRSESSVSIYGIITRKSIITLFSGGSNPISKKYRGGSAL